MTEARKRRTGGDLALILAAERLFAERGIAGVSLREVNQAANHRNLSAAHYHFGSREGLVSAVLEHRLPSLDHRRGLLLARDTPVKDMRFYIEAFVNPLIDEMAPRPEGNHYIRFMQQYQRSAASLEEVKRLTPNSMLIYAAIGNLLRYLPAAVRSLRIGYLINIIHAVLATVEVQLSAGETAFADVPLIAANLVDMVVPALAAPLSPATLDLLAPARPAEADGGR